MSGRALDLVAIPLRAVRRSVVWWSVGLASLVAATVAVWPAFKGSSGISQAIDQLPAGVVSAFGLQDFGTPAGYLRGNLYELFVPLLLTVAAVAMANGQTAGEEAAGRLELYLSQPVRREAVFAGRAVAVLIGLMTLTAVVVLVQLGIDASVDLQIDAGYLLSTIALCALLGALHGSLAIAVAGLRARPSMVMGIGIAFALGGYLVAALFPLSTLLAPWRHLSPWDWAFSGDPLTRATEVWRYAALALPTVALTLIGRYAFGRRDIAAG